MAVEGMAEAPGGRIRYHGVRDHLDGARALGARDPDARPHAQRHRGRGGRGGDTTAGQAGADGARLWRDVLILACLILTVAAAVAVIAARTVFQ